MIIFPQVLKAGSQRDICSPVFKAELFVLCKTYKPLVIHNYAWINKQNVVYVFDRILLSLLNEEYSDIYYKYE